jgi:hypothetical protein
MFPVFAEPLLSKLVQKIYQAGKVHLIVFEAGIALGL